jgi:4-hydroxy-3-methylbut-2-enyl diphosphate reductase
LVFSAHGVSKAVQDEAEARGFRIFDATCPLVTKVHVEVAKLHKEGYEFIMIGHKGHPEVEGTMGQLSDGIYLVEDVDDVLKVQPRQTDRLAVVTQTTLSVDDAAEISAAVQARFPQVRRPKQQDICYATQNRQDAVKFMAPQCDLVLVIGSPSSSNSNRLREVAEKMGKEARLIGSADELDPAWLAGKRRIGITAGASAPEVLVQALLDTGVEVAVLDLPASLAEHPVPAPALALEIDGSDAASVKKAFEALGQRWPALQGMVNLAGSSRATSACSRCPWKCLTR